MARLGQARQGKAVTAWHGSARRGWVWRGKAHLTLVHDSCYGMKVLRKGEL